MDHHRYIYDINFRLKRKKSQITSLISLLEYVQITKGYFM